ncbi:GNAT family N-acetyltransferase/peptidase C39 family protein [Acidovorax sp. NCPPB 3576]|uniref:GNAT family N-acetyltransferase/peptidase C39 family protein n=1 Tax=Acidovorax sp. NCPPB 3576 TaxID=2940488 RepID=UPI002349C44D|nr:peptidase C39 family protein [Acidovorax sp. NCPPB 3576]WCM86713.1 GNAT family N-acetyltransferase/peptidase C39 family protein [Acidovorax sp. NCPPB 3576]
MSKGRPGAASGLSIDAGAPADARALEAIERASFLGDRISLPSWRRLLRSRSARVMVARPAAGAAPGGGTLLGACVVLRRRGTSVARLYSIAVVPQARHGGIASAFLAEALDCARRWGCALLRLESRAENVAAHRLFQRFGFVAVGRAPAYYADGADAIRFEKDVFDGHRQDRLMLPGARHYGQTLDFTCGPCALLIAMSALAPDTVLDQAAEIRLWREATTVFMAAGHGGCGPFGLACAALRRGFGVAVYAAAGSSLFIDSVREPHKKRVIQRVEDDFRAELVGQGAPVFALPVSPEGVIEQLRHGHVPIVLISLWRLHREKAPHWVVITGFDGAVFRVLDPMARSGEGDGGVSVSLSEFKKMARYGRRRRTAAVILSRKP